jgi:thiosulfate dehydrogenase
MQTWSRITAGALTLAASGAIAWGVAGAFRPARAAGSGVEAGERDGWSSRTVWACDRRKAVVVEGVRPDEKLPPAKAQLVADLLGDLMRYCTEEITARIDVREVIHVEANGRVHHGYVPGGPLPIVKASFSEPTPREMQIWKAELDKLVAEGDRLFHSDEIGTNGMACAMCHPHASNTHPETYPKFQAQLKKVALLRDMVNWCIINPLEGPELAENDPKMKALEAYILAQRAGKALEAGKH